MNVLSFFQKKTSNDSHYLGLFLKSNEVTGFVFNITDRDCQIVSQEKVTYTNGLDTILQDIDSLISQLETQSGAHLQKTIFFLYSHFLDQKSKDIKKNYKAMIKNIAKNLELEPLGYIECHEAVATELQKVENGPLSGVITEIDTEHVNIIIYKGGTVTYTQTAPRLNPLPQDIELLLEEAKTKTVLPSKIVLYHSLHNEDEITTLVNHTWPVDIFNQLPKIELVSQEDLYKGLTNTFMHQISLIRESNQESESQNNSEAEKFGFSVGKDVQEQAIDEVPQITKKNMIANIKQLLSRIKLPKVPGKLLPRLLIVLSIIVILGFLAMTELFFHKTTIAIYLPSKSIKETLDYSSTEAGSLPIKNSSITSDYSQTVATSGKRDVGEKTHGEVTVNSFDDSERVITKGTTLTANNLTFVLDNDIKVASASVDGDVKKAGKTKTTITATEIGSEYNLDKNQKFTIEDLSSSDFFANNETALTGGSKKTVKTVAKKDMDDLKQKILAQAAQKAPTDSQNSNDKKIITKLTESKLIDSQYSKEVGEEASDITLKSKVEINLYYYTDSEIKKYISEKLKSEVPSGFIIDPNKVRYQLTSAQKDDDVINLKIKVDVTAIKQASYQSILDSLKGKPKKSLNDIVTNKLNADHFEILKSSHIVLLDSWMPFFQKNITLEITSQ